MSIEKFQPSYDIYPERIERLKAIAPEAFADGKINWDILRESLGSFVESEDAETEHYVFTWPGKREARRMAGKPPQGTLVPVPGEGVNENLTENIFIEGDNLEVLKLLQKSYAGKIKMIYIDPPYNTGNDFIYSDNYSQPLDEYLKLTGQADEKGNLLVSNKKSDGRFHTKWLNMIYPRLKLARNLMRDDGVIFISIDDNEIGNLRKVCDEIFGEENFIDNIVWKKRYGGGAKEKYLVSLHEYVLMYAKKKDAVGELFIPLDPSSIERYYKLKDKNYDKRGPYRTHPLEAGKAVDSRPNLIFPIKAPDGTLIHPKRQWYWNKDRVEEAIQKGEVEFVQGQDGWTVHSKQYLKDENGELRQAKAFSVIDDVFSQHGTNETIDSFGNAKIFSYPKPSKLISQLIQIGIEIQGEQQYVLDFFAGSCSTAHAVFDLNVQNHANIRFICVQLPEPCSEDSESFKAGYKTIADIGKERIRRIVKEIKGEKVLEEIKGQDLGFKVFKLQKSNFNEWLDYKGNDANELMELFAKQEDALVSGWKEEDLLTEILLQEGFPLHSKIETIEVNKANKVVQIKSEFCKHVIFICLDEKIDKKTIEQLPLTEKDIFICLDSALTDEQKVALADKGVIKTI